jgi:hypothetical protein
MSNIVTVFNEQCFIVKGIESIIFLKNGLCSFEIQCRYDDSYSIDTTWHAILLILSKVLEIVTKYVFEDTET